MTDSEMARLHLYDLLTMAEIGRRSNLTAERVRQRLRRHGVTPEATAEVVRQRRFADVECEACGRAYQTPRSKPRRYCEDDECQDARGHEHALEMRWRNPHDGHLWVREPGTGRKVRAARYLAQRREGRPLARNEWAILLDRDPDNLEESNIAIMSPSAFAKWRRERAA